MSDHQNSVVIARTNVRSGWRLASVPFISKKVPRPLHIVLPALSASESDEQARFAQNRLGKMYDDGKGVPQDYVSAHMWYNLAAAGGQKMSIENRDAVAAKMTPSQIAEAQKLAREWEPTTSNR